MLKSVDGKRDALAGVDDTNNTAFILLFANELKIGALYAKYSDNANASIAKQSLSFSLMVWLNVIKNETDDKKINSAITDELIDRFLIDNTKLYPSLEFWAEKYDKKTKKMTRVELPKI